MKNKKNRAVFLDRDGTLLNERGYLSDPKKIVFYRNALRGLKILKDQGYKLIVLTNQSGVGRGYFSLETLKKVHQAFRQKCKAKGVSIDGIYFCPHLPGAGCACRKPKPALAQRAARDMKVDLKRSYLIGDQERDMQLAARIGASGILVLTGAGRTSRSKLKKRSVKITRDLLSASRWIVRDDKN